MDLTYLLTPGAQSLVSTILTDGWAKAASALARLWAGRHSGEGEQTDPAALEAAGRELETARLQALELAGTGTGEERAERMRLFWIGYLAGQLAARPELAEAVQALPVLLGSGAAPGVSITTVRNTITGKVQGSAVQTGDIHGDLNFGGR